jgi:chromosome segregation ATPase
MVSFWQGMSELSSTLPSPSADLTIVTVPVHRNGVLAMFNKSSADLSDARHTNNQLTVRVTELQDQCDALTATKQFLDGQVTSLQQACSEYDRKEQDCNVLRVTTRKLEDQLHATQITARNFRSKSQQLQNGLDFALDCNEDYERNIRSKQQDIDALEQQLKALQCTGNTDSSKLDTPKQSLQNAQAQLTELHLSTKTQGIHIAKLEADRISDQELLHDRNLQLDTHRHSITVLQTENDVLASRLATAQHQATQQIELLHAFNHQLLDLTNFHAEQQQQQQNVKAQRDGLYAQLQQDRTRFEATLKAKDAAHQALDAKLQEYEERVARQASVREEKIADLKEQLRRLKLDCDSAEAEKKAWAEYANGGR